MNYTDEQQDRLTQRKAIQKTGIRGNNQLCITTKFPFTRETLMAKLTAGDYSHIHSLMETTISFFAGYDTRIFPQLGRGKKNYYNRAPL